MSIERVFCICQSNEEESCDFKNILLEEENKFSTFDDLCKKLPPTKFAAATIDGSFEEEDGRKRWKWEKIKGCDEFYYVLLFKRGKRRRHHEILCDSAKTNHMFPGTVDQVLALPMFEKKTGAENPNYHKFLVIKKANGEEFDMVIDLLSMVKKESRMPERRCPVYFGFLSPSYSKLGKCERVALKREEIKPGSEDKVKSIRKEIDLALKAGGQYNMKYLACTKIESSSDEIWIAMELCCMETLDDLVMDKKEGERFSVDHDQMKICFRQILLGLSHLHQMKIAHGEMIMENILLSYPDRQILKIGDYDHVKQVERDDSDNASEGAMKNDLMMTASMFYMCLQRNVRDNSKDMVDAISKSFKDWIMSLEAKIEPEITTVTKIIFPNIQPQIIDQQLESKRSYPSPSWPSLLRALAKMLPPLSENSPDPYLSAYLIMHLALDNPKPEDVIKHPFFWDEFKILCFIGRADAFFFNEENHDLKNTVTQVKSQFQTYFGYLWRELDWMEDVQKSLEKSLKKGPGKSEKAMKTIMSKAHEATNAKYGPSDVCGLLRVVRNVHNHYHAPGKNDRWFGSSSDVWKFFNELYPGMICLLHRAVWEKRDSEELADDLRHFFNKHTYILNLPKSGAD